MLCINEYVYAGVCGVVHNIMCLCVVCVCFVLFVFCWNQVVLCVIVVCCVCVIK